MAKVKASKVAVYVFRSGPVETEYLQLHRVEENSEYPNTWQVIYGGIKKGETAVETALRELREETGFAPLELFQVEYIESFYQQSKDRIIMMPVFAVRVGKTARPVLDHEHDQFRWVPLTDVVTNFVWRSQRQAIEIIQMDVIADTNAKSLLRIPPKVSI